MFCISFGWPKASKCKKLIKRLRWRLDLLKIKRHSMIKQLRQDMAQLIKLGCQETAFNRADQLFKDECSLAVYEMLDNFCEFIILNLSYIRKHKDIPNDVNEAVSSLVFASARCGDLPELLRIRELFGKRYGLSFAAAAVDFLPGNLVNREMRKKLSTDEVSDEVKYELVDEIAKDYCLTPELLLSLQYHSHQSKHQEQQQPDNSDSNSEFISISVSCSPDKLDSPVHTNKEEVESSSGRKLHKPLVLSSSEISSPCDFHEEMVVYLDDIEELGTSAEDGVHWQEQRVFKFKPLSVSTWKKVEEDYSSSSSRSEDLVPCYSRTMTMPQQRPPNDDNNLMRESLVRTISCPIQQSTHVHPKLPNYDEIAAKFSALKMECLQNKKPCQLRGMFTRITTARAPTQRIILESLPPEDKSAAQTRHKKGGQRAGYQDQ